NLLNVRLVTVDRDSTSAVDCQRQARLTLSVRDLEQDRRWRSHRGRQRVAVDMERVLTFGSGDYESLNLPSRGVCSMNLCVSVIARRFWVVLQAMKFE